MNPCGALRADTASRSLLQTQSGFSLVELVVVMVLIGLLSAVAVPRFFGNTVFEQRAFLDEVMSALRYGRTLAIGSGCPVRVQLNPSGYTLSQQAMTGGHCDTADNTWPVAVKLPDGQVFGGSAPASVTISPTLNVVFNAAGGTNLAADQSITVGTETFLLRAGSGFVSP